MGVSSLTGRIILLEDFKMDYTPGEIRKFIKWWEEGQPVSYIAEKFFVSIDEIGVLVIHCRREGWIDTRPGGLLGTVKKKRRERIKIGD